MKTTVSVIKIVLKQASKIMTDDYLDLNITEIILHSFSASSFFSSSVHFSLFVAFHLLLKVCLGLSFGGFSIKDYSAIY